MEKYSLITIKQFCQKYPWPSQAAMRGYIFREGKSRLKDAFFKIGRRVLIDENKFFEIIKTFNNEGK